MGTAIEVSGGSGANTTVGVASFGGAAHYLGRVRDDLKARIDRALSELSAARSRRADVEGRMAELRRPL